MQKLVVVYDITDNTTRRIVGEILEGYGTRVNRSVFECQVKHTKERQVLEATLQKEIDPKVDSLRIYTVCATCMSTSIALAKEPQPFTSDAIYFF
jgi:CRISPR-associated protein Cas2